MSNTNSLQNIAQSGYDDLSSLGKIEATIGFIIACVICVILIIIAIYLIYSDNDNDYLHIDGKITNAQCDRNVYTTATKNGTQQSISYNCTLAVSYTIDNKTYTNNVTTNSNSQYATGLSIPLLVSKTNYNNISVAGWRRRTFGFIVSGISIVVFLCSFVSYYLTRKSKVYAAASGVGDIVNIFRH